MQALTTPASRSLGKALSTLQGYWIRIALLTKDPADLGSFPGAVFRGGFGHALRKAICPDLSWTCKLCPQSTTCSFPSFFDAKTPAPGTKGLLNGHRPQSFALRVGLAGLTSIPTGAPTGHRQPWGNGRMPEGSVIYVDILLIGDALSQLERCVEAIVDLGIAGVGIRGRGRRGVGARYDLLSVWSLTPDATGVLKPDCDLAKTGLTNQLQETQSSNLSTSLLPEYAVEDAAPCLPTGPMRLVIPNGLHLKKQGRLQIRPTFRDLVSSTLRRWTRLSAESISGREENGDPLEVRGILEAAESIDTRAQHLTKVALERYSTRKDRRHRMEAIRGTWVLAEEANRFLPIVLLAERLGVGKGSTFGLGELSLVRSTP